MAALSLARSPAPRGGDLMQQLHDMGPSTRRISSIDPRQDALPDELSVVRWCAAADARLGAVLADFDDALLSGAEPASTAAKAFEDLRSWIVDSLVPFATPASQRLVTQAARVRERAAWDRDLQITADEVYGDPEALDRLLLRLVATVHEAIATGYAALYLPDAP